jgi:hypothetical protein
VQHCKKHNEPLLKGSISTQKYLFCGLKEGKFTANDKEVLEFVLEKCKNGICYEADNKNGGNGRC